MIKIIYAMKWLHTKISIFQECTAENAIPQTKLTISNFFFLYINRVYRKKVNKAKNAYYGESEKKLFPKKCRCCFFFHYSKHLHYR